MKTFEELKQEAIARGIKQRAVVRSPYGTVWVAGPINGWRIDSGGGLHDCGKQIYSPMQGCWATVITPAPEDQPEGLVDGMACEPDEHMRRAIVEKAIELGAAIDRHVYALNVLLWQPTGPVYLRQTNDSKCADIKSIITPGEFYDRLCKTAKPEPPIRIGGRHVEFNKGSIKVGRTEVPNDIVRKVAERLVD